MSRLSSVSGSGSRGDAASGRVDVNPWRAGMIFTVLVLVSAGFVWKLVDLQLSPDDDLLNNLGSYLREENIDASRGNIVDRHGRLLAFSVPRPSIVGDPRAIAHSDSLLNVDDIVAALATVLGTDPQVMDTRLRSDKSFVYLERQVEPEVGEAVAALGLPGIWIMPEQYREHPNGPCSALSVVGRVDTEQVGISGLEKQYDEQLEGSPGSALRQTQLVGAVQIPDGYHVVEPHTPGEDLRLSIDRNIQYEAEQTSGASTQRNGEHHGHSDCFEPPNRRDICHGKRLTQRRDRRGRMQQCQLRSGMGLRTGINHERDHIRGGVRQWRMGSRQNSRGPREGECGARE